MLMAANFLWQWCIQCSSFTICGRLQNHNHQCRYHVPKFPALEVSHLSKNWSMKVMIAAIYLRIIVIYRSTFIKNRKINFYDTLPDLVQPVLLLWVYWSENGNYSPANSCYQQTLVHFQYSSFCTMQCRVHRDY